MSSWRKLFKACADGDVDKIKRLLAPRKLWKFDIPPKANVNDRNSDGVPALCIAAFDGHKDVVELLISKGADVNDKAKLGGTPLWSAIIKGHEDVAKLLISKGANVNDEDSHTFLLHNAAANGLKDIVELLVSKGMDVNARDSSGNTALHRAVFNKHIDVVKFLIKNGAAVNIENEQHERPMYHAVLFKQKEIINLLEAARSSANDSRVPPEKFAEHAIAGPARCQIDIRKIPSVVNELVNKLKSLEISNDDLLELWNNSLLSVCPICDKYSTGKALLMMEALGGANTVFTGNSGGFERMVEGKCLNYSCNSTTHEFFWCPDLSSIDLADLHSRGINIDPNTQQKRDHVWKPKKARER